MNSPPLRGDIWLANLDPVIGHEQGGMRPCFIMSADRFNQSPLDLAVIIPLTSRKKSFPSHIEIATSESGLRIISYAKCEDIRSISKARLLHRIGQITKSTLKAIEDKVKIILDF